MIAKDDLCRVFSEFILENNLSEKFLEFLDEQGEFSLKDLGLDYSSIMAQADYKEPREYE